MKACRSCNEGCQHDSQCLILTHEGGRSPFASLFWFHYTVPASHSGFTLLLSLTRVALPADGHLRLSTDNDAISPGCQPKS